MSYGFILYEQDGPVVKITLNRPEVLNALNEPLVLELRDALDSADRNPEIRAVVLAGAGRSFCAGYDMKREGGGTVSDPGDHGNRRLSAPLVAERPGPH